MKVSQCGVKTSPFFPISWTGTSVELEQIVMEWDTRVKAIHVTQEGTESQRFCGKAQ